MDENLKVYILIKDTLPLGMALNSMCHAGYLIEKHFPKLVLNDKYSDFAELIYDPIMKEWWDNKIKKVTCKVTEEQFEQSKKYEDWFVVTESALNDAEVIIVFKPKKEWPKFFNFLSLYN